MEWLEVNRDKLDCYDKIIECIDDEGGPQLVKEMLKKISVRKPHINYFTQNTLPC